MLHKLSLLDASTYSSGLFLCNICHESGCGPVFHCADCDFDVHEMCVATAKQQTHFSHPHHLLRLVQRSTLHHTCNSCGMRIHTLSFQCDMCDFDIHPTCVRAPRYIKHHSHRHPLALSQSSATTSNRHCCNGCRRPVERLFYECNGILGRCNYVLHQYCASLPSSLKHPKHPHHILKLLNQTSQEKTFSCDGCGACGSRGWRFRCASCDFSLHPGCAASVHEYVQPHQDPEAAIAQRGHDATSSLTTCMSAMSEVSHASVLQAVSQAPTLSDNDWEAFQKVLHFAQELVKCHSSIDAKQNTSESCVNEPEDICPTCLEGYNNGNPKKLTSCGHHFHLNCILNWMDRSSYCPICRKGISIPM